jgi:hypothetical protein
MRVTRRDALKLTATATALGAVATRATARLEAAKAPPMPPIVTSGGIRLYPSWDAIQWWATEPVTGWDLGHIVSLGATLAPDGATSIQDTRNTPLHGQFTRAYFQLSTRPLSGAQSLSGVVSAAVHCIEWHRRIDARLAMQVVVHRPDTTVRGIALPLTVDSLEFTLGNPPKSRAAQNWQLTPVSCEDGDVIAINLGIFADNQSNLLAQGVGVWVYASEAADISRVEDPAIANSWVEFSEQLVFQPPPE